MSMTETKRHLSDAMQDATAFRDLFADCFENWEIAGSVRRKVREVGDVEHVVIPRFGDVEVRTGLFVERRRANLLWTRLDALVGDGSLNKHVYGATGYRWGEKYRGCDFRGFNHEIFCADADNFGPTLAIRTGPAEFSKTLVTRLYRQLHRNIDGYVWRCERCPNCLNTAITFKCAKCDGTNLIPVDRISVPTEREYFALAGMPYLDPPARR